MKHYSIHQFNDLPKHITTIIHLNAKTKPIYFYYCVFRLFHAGFLNKKCIYILSILLYIIIPSNLILQLFYPLKKTLKVLQMLILCTKCRWPKYLNTAYEIFILVHKIHCNLIFFKAISRISQSPPTNHTTRINT